MRFTTKELVLISMMTALTAVGAFIAIPVGPVPITLQSFFVLMSGLLLGAKCGAMSQFLYMALGLIGLPIFSGGKGGFGAVLSPSFGFIIGFIIVAYIVGKMSEKAGTNKLKIVIAAFTGTVILFFIGIPYMALILNVYMAKGLSTAQIFQAGLIPFIPGGIVKFFFAITITSKLKSILKLNTVTQ